MEKERNNTGLIVAVTVLTMLVLGLVGFIVYDKVINKTDEPNTEENNNSNGENDEVTNEDREVVTSIGVNDKLVASLKYPTKETVFDVWGYENVKADEWSRAEKMNIAASEVSYKDVDYDPELDLVHIKVYDAKLVEQNFKAMFGPDVDYYNGDIGSSRCCAIDEYDKNKNTYSAECACGQGAPVTYDYVTKKYKAEQSNDYLYVYEYVQVVIYDEIEEKTYLSNANYDKLTVVDNKNYESKVYALMDEGKVDTYKWTFKKQSDGKYYFYSGAWEN